MTRARLVAGIMSGTSADGVDVALVRLDDDDRPALLAAGETPFDAELRGRVLALAEPGGGTTQDVARLHMQLARVYADALAATLRHAAVARADLIGCHGQTVAHLPAAGVTFQAGSGPALAALAGTPVVFDFRAGDVALGGQGAPLIPFVDWLLFREHARGGALGVLNLGGIANVTILPTGVNGPADLLAFDTGPANMALDGLAMRLTGQACDRDGALAAAGTVDEDLLAELLAHEYFARPLPKSAGREEFGAAFVDELLRRGAGLPAADLLATATALTARSVARALPPVRALVLGGGGARNATLRRMLAESLPEVAIQRHEDYGWPSDAKEALGFALLADAAVRGVPAGLPNVTGARAPLVLGAVAPGPPPRPWPDWIAGGA